MSTAVVTRTNTDVALPDAFSEGELGDAVACIRAAARFDGHDMLWAMPEGRLHDLCVELERRGEVDRHDDVASPFVGWRPR